MAWSTPSRAPRRSAAPSSSGSSAMLAGAQAHGSLRPRGVAVTSWLSPPLRWWWFTPENPAVAQLVRGARRAAGRYAVEAGR